MRIYKVLVFPCGSECGLEIGRSLSNLKEIELWGASSVDDHGKYFYTNYLGNLPFVDDPSLVERINDIIAEHDIDFVFPAMDSVISAFSQAHVPFRDKLICSPPETVAVAESKRKTYAALKGVVRCPHVYEPQDVTCKDFPLFLKPAVGFGSRGVALVHNREELTSFLDKAKEDTMILEYLPGKEYTIDCFTDFSGALLVSCPRIRNRISRGISVHTESIENSNGLFSDIAKRINEVLTFNGAWFFQLKYSAEGELCLLEIATRIAGSMGLSRCKGMNLPLLSVFNRAGISVQPLENNYQVEFDRALYNKVRLSYGFTTLYLDFDDCLLLREGHLNCDIVKLMAQCRNKHIPVILLSRHDGDLEARLTALGVRSLVDEVIHLQQMEQKSHFMKDPNGFLIDDSFQERKDAALIGIPSLGPESVEALLC